MNVRIHIAILLAALALVVALSGVAGAVAGSVLIGSKQIRNGSVKSVDLKNAGVTGTDLQTGSVGSVDLKNNGVDSPDLAPESVEGEALDLQEPIQCQAGGEVALAVPSGAYQPVATLCSANKTEAESALEVSWTGSVDGRNGGEISGCSFQLRVNGAGAAAGAGATFGKGITSANASAIFEGIPAGPVAVEVWAKINVDTPAGNSCVVGPSAAGIPQTVTIVPIVS